MFGGCLSLGWRTQGSKACGDILDILSLYGDLERDVPEHLDLLSELRREVQAADSDPRGS